jgi:peroxiredoxin
MAEKLGIGAQFPKVTLTLTDGGTMTLPDDIASNYTVVLFYRGHW